MKDNISRRPRNSSFPLRTIIVREMRITDWHSIHKMYDSLSEEDKAFFHPGFLGYDNINFAWLIFQVHLLLSCIRPLRKILLKMLPRIVFLPLVAIYQNRIIGFAYIKVKRRMPDRGFCATLSVIVDNIARGTGLASILMESLLRLAHQENIREISLMVLLNNIRAISLYKKYGFNVVGKTIDCYRGKIH